MQKGNTKQQLERAGCANDTVDFVGSIRGNTHRALCGNRERTGSQQRRHSRRYPREVCRGATDPLTRSAPDTRPGPRLSITCCIEGARVLHANGARSGGGRRARERKG
eukprot:3032295-Rhodomonas_salina.2